MTPAQRPAPAHATAAELARHASRFVSAFSLMAIAVMCAAGVWEVDGMRRARVDEADEIARFRKDYLEFSTSLGKKMDQQAEAIITQTKGFREALVLVRSQLHENTNVTAKAATANTQIAQEAVKQAAATTQIADKIVAAPDPVVKVEVPKAAPPVVVQAPAPAAAHVITQPAPPTDTPGGFRQWFKKAFCPWCGRGRKRE